MNAVTTFVKKCLQLPGRVRRKLAYKRFCKQIEQVPAPAQLRGGERAILVFAPTAGIEPIFATTCVVARTLAARHVVYVTRCFDCFARCGVMDMHQLPSDAAANQRAPLCTDCAWRSQQITTSYGLQSLDLRSYVTRDIVDQVNTAMAGASKDLREFVFDSIRFGNLAAADLVLCSKDYELEVIDEKRRHTWLSIIRSAVTAYLVVGRICKELGVGHVLYSNDYAISLAGRLAAERWGVPAHLISLASHRNVDFRRYVIVPDIWQLYWYRAVPACWPRWQDMPLPAAMIAEVASDLVHRFSGRGSHVYSPAHTATANVRTALGLSERRKLLVAYTSSLDEVLASRQAFLGVGREAPPMEGPFPDQIAWLKALVDQVSKSDDLELVVRVHPREGMNKGGTSIKSLHLQKLRQEFDRPLEHCRFVWPEDKISSYDLGEAADVALSGWSTIGMELARLGVPVLLAFRNASAHSPWGDFAEYGATPNEYFAKLRMLLTRPTALETVARAFRWYHFYNMAGSLDLSDVVANPEYTGLPKYRVPKAAEAIETAITGSADVLDRNWKAIHDAQTLESGPIEREALQAQLRRLVHVLMVGTEPQDNLPLFMVDAAQIQEKSGRPHGFGVSQTSKARHVAVNGNRVIYADGEARYDRHSPMIARLVRLCSQLRQTRADAA